MTPQETINHLATTEEKALAHFISLARRGRGQGASGGERRAARLANAILENTPGLDGDAIEGILQFARLASARYEFACDLLDGKVKPK